MKNLIILASLMFTMNASANAGEKMSIAELKSGLNEFCSTQWPNSSACPSGLDEINQQSKCSEISALLLEKGIQVGLNGSDISDNVACLK